MVSWGTSHIQRHNSQSAVTQDFVPEFALAGWEEISFHLEFFFRFLSLGSRSSLSSVDMDLVGKLRSQAITDCFRAEFRQIRAATALSAAAGPHSLGMTSLWAIPNRTSLNKSLSSSVDKYSADYLFFHRVENSL